jgi:hypothetical protein
MGGGSDQELAALLTAADFAQTLSCGQSRKPPSARRNQLRRRLLARRQQSPDQPKQGKNDPNNEHHPVALAEGHDAQGHEQDEVEDAAENEADLDSPFQVVGGRYESP